MSAVLQYAFFFIIISVAILDAFSTQLREDIRPHRLNTKKGMHEYVSDQNSRN